MTGYYIRIIVISAALLASGNPALAQIFTVKGDFYTVVRTVEQTADSVMFAADTLVLSDNGAGLGNLQTGDSIAIMFVQNRFRFANDMLNKTKFNYIRARVRYDSGMLLARQAYDGVPLGLKKGKPVKGRDTAVEGREIGLRPVYRDVWAIARSSVFNSDPSAIRQIITLEVKNPVKGLDAIQLWNMHFKPNINNLTGLAMPPDTTHDTLRAYHLDGGLISAGDVMFQTDLAIVRLMPGTTRILMWVNDSAQSVDAGEYFGSFGDYSRGRYFLGDDGLPQGKSRTLHFRPSTKSYAWGPGEGNPDEGMQIDGDPPEEKPLREHHLYRSLAPFWFTSKFPAFYPEREGDFCGNPNPENGVIPPYRIGEYAVSHDVYQPGLVTSAVDTLRFFDCWGNRTWDVRTEPELKVLAYNGSGPEDRTRYLMGVTEEGDVLRQTGQVVYRRLSMNNTRGAIDSIRILATATVRYKKPNGKAGEVQALADTSGGFPRVWRQEKGIRYTESEADNGERMLYIRTLDADRIPPNPQPTAANPPMMDTHVLPPTGIKIAVRPNIPRKVHIAATPVEGNPAVLRLDIRVMDAWGNPVDDNERFKCELAPFDENAAIAFRTEGVFDSIPGVPLDSGRISVGPTTLGEAVRYFHAPEGRGTSGTYRIRVRVSYNFPENNGALYTIFQSLRLDPFPTGNPPTTGGWAHGTIIPSGSPNNNFGAAFDSYGSKYCEADPKPGIDARLGTKPGQTTAVGWIDLHWDGKEWREK